MNRTPGRFSSCQKFTELLMIEGQVPHFLCDFHDELHVLEPSFGAKFVYCSLRTATKRFQAGDRCAMDGGGFFFWWALVLGLAQAYPQDPKRASWGLPSLFQQLLYLDILPGPNFCLYFCWHGCCCSHGCRSGKRLSRLTVTGNVVDGYVNNFLYLLSWGVLILMLPVGRLSFRQDY